MSYSNKIVDNIIGKKKKICDDAFYTQTDPLRGKGIGLGYGEGKGPLNKNMLKKGENATVIIITKKEK